MSDGLILNEFRPNKSFTAVVKVLFENEKSADDSNSVFLTIGSPVEVQHTPQFCFAIKGKRTPNILVYTPGKEKSGKDAKYISLGEQNPVTINAKFEFQVAFVQDKSQMTWTAYIHNTDFKTKHKQQIAIPNDFTWQEVDQPLQVLGFQAPTTGLVKTQNWRGKVSASLFCT